MDRLLALILLKLRLTLRAGRGVGHLIAWLLFLLAFVLPLGLGGALFSYAGFSGLDGLGDRELLDLLLFGVWLFWLVFPLIGFSLNQSYDLTRLFIYPLSHASIFAANLLGCFLDPSLLIPLPLFCVIVYFFSTSVLAAVVTALVLLAFLAQTVALSQAVLWALLNLLRSRRLRDWVILIAPLIGLAVYLAPQLALRAPTTSAPFQALIASEPSQYLQFTPSGLASATIFAAARDRWLDVLAYSAGSLFYLLFALALGAVVLGRLHSGEVGRYRAARADNGRAARGGLLERAITSPLTALAVKELRYYWREPRLKSMFAAPLFPIVFVLAGSVMRPHGVGFGPTWGVPLTALMALFSFSSLFQNAFGMDREGLRLLFLLPCDRRDILLGKNLPAILVAWLAASAAVVVAGFILGDPYLALAALPFILAATTILAGVGNIVSIHFPIRVARRGENPFTSSSGRGCLNAFIGTLALQLALVLAVPVFLAGAAPIVLRSPGAYAACAPLALAYAAGVYYGLLRFYSARALQRREMDILEECLAGEPAA